MFLGKECYDCQEKFTPFRRRHHCKLFNLINSLKFHFILFYYLGRICGLLFCNRCCSYEPQVKLAGYSESNIRLCSYCSSTLLKLPKTTSIPAASSNPQYPLSTSQIDHNQQQQQQQQSQQYSQDLNSSDSTYNSDHFSLSKTSNDHLLLNVNNDQTSNSNEENLTNPELNPKHSQQQQSQQRSNTNFNLKSLFNEIFRTSQGLQMQKQRQFFRTIECVTGKDIVDWLIKNQRATILSEAKLLCQCFLNELYLEPVILPQTSFIEFKPDQTLYKLGKVKFRKFDF